MLGTHVITDETVAFALRQSAPERRRSAFWACGVALFVVWNVSVLLGVALGSTVRDTNAFGLDATFPAVMLALALPTLTSRPTRLAAAAGAVIAVALTPVLPAGLPLLASLGGLATRWNGWRGPLGREARSESPDDGDAVADESELPVGGGR
jgi:predicted branched-subunit amino acid permease